MRKLNDAVAARLPVPLAELKLDYFPVCKMMDPSRVLLVGRRGRP
jgi:hypothetical protein